MLAHGVKHYKEDKEGRENMCEAVEKYARECAIRERVCNVKNLMDSLKFTVDQALDALKIQGTERNLIIDQLQKQ